MSPFTVVTYHTTTLWYSFLGKHSKGIVRHMISETERKNLKHLISATIHRFQLSDRCCVGISHSAAHLQCVAKCMKNGYFEQNVSILKKRNWWKKKKMMKRQVYKLSSSVHCDCTLPRVTHWSLAYWPSISAENLGIKGHMPWSGVMDPLYVCQMVLLQNALLLKWGLCHITTEVW